MYYEIEWLRASDAVYAPGINMLHLLQGTDHNDNTMMPV